MEVIITPDFGELYKSHKKETMTEEKRWKILERVTTGWHLIANNADELTKEECEPHVLYYNARGEDTEPRFDQTVEDYLDNGEEYAYLFENNEWVCYDLHYDTPMDVPIPQKSEETVA